MIYILSIASKERCQLIKSKTFSLKTVIKELDFVSKTVMLQWNACIKEDLFLIANKSIEKIHVTCNTKENYQLFIGKKSTKSVRQSKIITYQPKKFKNQKLLI